MIVTAVFLFINACPLSPLGGKQKSFCRSSDLRFGKYYFCQSGSALPVIQ
jgi:hypothetical protein